MAGAKVRGITIELGADTSGLQRALKTANSSIRNTQKSLRDVNRLMRVDPTNVELAGQKYKNLQKVIAETKTKLKTLKDAEKELASQMKDGGTEEQQEQMDALKREIIATEQALKKYNSEVGSGNASLAVFGAKAESLGGKLTAIGDKLKVASAAFVAIGAAALKSFKDVDKGADAVITATGAVGDQAKELVKNYENVASNIVGDFGEIGSTVGEVSTRFGLTGKALENLSIKFEEFSKITGQDSKAAVQGVDKALKTFNLDQSQAVNAMGLLAKASQDTGISVETLENLLQQSGPALKEMGLGFSESVNLMALFEKNGLDSATMLTGLKKAATNFSKSGMDMNTGLSDLVKRLQDNATAADATKEAYDIFGSRAGLAFVTAAKEGKISLDNLSSDLNNYASVVSDTYKQTLDGGDQIALAWQRIKISASKLGSTVGKTIAPALTKVAKIIEKVTKKFDSLSDGSKKTIVAFMGVGAALSPLLKITGNAVSAIGRLSKALSTAQAATLVANAGWIALGAAIVGAIAIFAKADSAHKKMWSDVDTITSKLQQENNAWKEMETARKSAMSEAVGAANVNNSLLASLTSLVDANGRVKQGEEERAKVILGQLNQALGTQYELTGNVISENGKQIESNKALADSIRAVIKQKEAEALINANEEEYNNAIANRVENEKLLANALKKKQELEQQIADIRQKQATQSDTATTNEIRQWSSDLTVAQASLAELDGKIKEYNGNLNKGSQAIELHDKLTRAMAVGGEELNTVLMECTQGVTAFNGANEKAVKKSADSAIKNFQNVADAYKNGTDNISKSTLNSMAQTVAEAIAQLEASGGDVYEATKGLTDDQRRALEEASVDSSWSDSAKAGIEAYKAAMDGGKSSVGTKASEVSKVAAKGLGSAEKDAKDAGSKASTNYGLGFGLKTATVAANANAIAASAKGKLTQYNNDGKGGARTWGSDFIGKFGSGISDKSGSVLTKVSNLAASIAAKLHFSRPDEGPLRNYETWMPDFMQGLAKGIKENMPLVTDKIEALAENITKTLDTTGQINIVPEVNTDSIAKSQKQLQQSLSFNATAEVSSSNMDMVLKSGLSNMMNELKNVLTTSDQTINVNVQSQLDSTLVGEGVASVVVNRYQQDQRLANMRAGIV